MRIACTAEELRIIVNGERYSHWHFDDNYIFRDENYEPISVHGIAEICRKNKAYIQGIVDGARVMAGKYTKGLSYKDGVVIAHGFRVVQLGSQQVITDMEGKRVHPREASRIAGVPSEYMNGIIAGTRNMRGIVKRGLVG